MFKSTLSTLLTFLAAAGPSVLALVARRPGEASAAAAALSARADAGPSFMTITVVNSHVAAISTVHADNAGPTPVSGNKAAGTMTVGEMAAFVVPTGWAGNVQVVEYGGGREIVGDESWIEGSLASWSGTWKVGIDVSYVNGFSVPITCSCSSTEKFMSGCSKNLWEMGQCAVDNGVGSCKNPTRPYMNVTQPSDFFKPCAGKAYTFPADNDAMSEGTCQDGQVTCCVGTGCSN